MREVKMDQAAILLAEGFEEIEALTVVDVLRRGGGKIRMISVTDQAVVTGKNGISVVADGLLAETDFTELTMLILPGGIPGVTNLRRQEDVRILVTRFMRQRRVAAICAAPTLLGGWGLLDGRWITCYPGCGEDCQGALVLDEEVVTDGNLITGRAMAGALAFSLRILAVLTDAATAERVAQGIVYTKK